MQTWIALLRGINVGGKNVLPMAQLRPMLAELGCHHVKTYIQSGNVVFQSNAKSAATLASTIRQAINARHGFQPHVMLLTSDDLQLAITKNPFPEAEDEPNTLHLFFLSKKPPAPDQKALETLRVESEQFQLVNQVLYLHAPKGIGRSKLAANVERLLSVPTTARNWRSVQKISQLARELT